MEGVATLGTLDPQHAIAQLVNALADQARAFASDKARQVSCLRALAGRTQHDVERIASLPNTEIGHERTAIK